MNGELSYQSEFPTATCGTIETPTRQSIPTDVAKIVFQHGFVQKNSSQYFIDVNRTNFTRMKKMSAGQSYTNDNFASSRDVEVIRHQTLRMAQSRMTSWMA